MFMECPHKYWLAQVRGYRARGEAVDLEFGSWVHLGIETFYRCIIENGMSHDDAVKRAAWVVMRASWDIDEEVIVGDDAGPYVRQHELGPKLGEYQQVWRCKGDVKGYKNAKGNAAKCPYSHAGKYFEGHGPSQCGECGGGTIETMQKWIPVSKVKDRYNAVRAVVWYAEEMKGAQLQPVSFKRSDQHIPMLEINSRLPLNDGKGTELISNFDAVKSFGEELFIVDYKTTGAALTAPYFARFNPDVQVDFYGTFGPAMQVRNWPDISLGSVGGVVIEAMQILQNGVRFGMRVFRYTHEQRVEIARELAMEVNGALSYAETYGKDTPWPRNRSSCRMCAFKAVCSAPPAAREIILAEQYDRVRWNPITRKLDEVKDE